MKDSKVFIKLSLVVGLICTIVGGLIFTIAMSVNKWNFEVFATQKIEPKTYEITDYNNVSTINVDLSVADVTLLYHDEQKIVVDCYDVRAYRDNEIIRETTVAVNGNALNIKKNAKKFTWLSIGSFGEEKVVIKVPKGKRINFIANLSTGDVTIGEKGLDCYLDDVAINTSTGDVKIEANVTCNTLKIEADTGDTYINGKLNANKIEREADTGFIKINASIIAHEIYIEHDTGDVKCNAYITAKKIEIDTSTGDVTLRLLGKKEDYSYVYEMSTGESNIPAFTGGVKIIKIDTSTGDADLYFEN